MTNRKRVLALLNEREVVRLDEMRGKQSASSFLVDLLNAEYARRRQEKMLEKMFNKLADTHPDLIAELIGNGLKASGQISDEELKALQDDDEVYYDV